MRKFLSLPLLFMLACGGQSQEPRAWWSTPVPGPAPTATLYWRPDGRAMVGLRAVVAGATLTTVRETTGPILQDGVYHTTFEVLWGGDPAEQEVLVVGVCPDGEAPKVRIRK